MINKIISMSENGEKKLDFIFKLKVIGLNNVNPCRLFYVGHLIIRLTIYLGSD